VHQTGTNVLRVKGRRRAVSATLWRGFDTAVNLVAQALAALDNPEELLVGVAGVEGEHRAYT
jgi:hypothetical protein